MPANPLLLRTWAQQAKAAERHQRRLAEAPALRQERELDGHVVEIEEPARAGHVAAAQLDEVDAVEGQEALARGQHPDLAPVRAEEAPGQAGVALRHDLRAAGLDAHVG